VQRLDRRAGCGSQLIAKKGPQIFIDHQRLRHITASGQGRHQEAIPGLAQRSRRDQRPREFLRGGQLGAPSAVPAAADSSARRRNSSTSQR